MINFKKKAGNKDGSIFLEWYKYVIFYKMYYNNVVISK